MYVAGALVAVYQSILSFFYSSLSAARLYDLQVSIKPLFVPIPIVLSIIEGHKGFDSKTLPYELPGSCVLNKSYCGPTGILGISGSATKSSSSSHEILPVK